MQIVIRESNGTKSVLTLPTSTGYLNDFANPYPQFSALFPIHCKTRNVYFERIDRFTELRCIYLRIYHAVVLRRFAYSNSAKQTKKKKAGITANSFANNRKKDVNEKPGYPQRKNTQLYFRRELPRLRLAVFSNCYFFQSNPLPWSDFYVYICLPLISYRISP